MNGWRRRATGLVDARRIGPVSAMGVGLVALGFLFHREVFAVISVWRSSTEYNHCSLIIPVVLHLLYERRDALRDAWPSPYPLANLSGVPLAIVWLAAERAGIMEGPSS